MKKQFSPIFWILLGFFVGYIFPHSQIITSDRTKEIILPKAIILKEEMPNLNQNLNEISGIKVITN